MSSGGGGQNAAASSSSGGQNNGSQLKRVARACLNCRNGKNRCDGVAPCSRCVAADVECVFEKPAPKKRRTSVALSGEDGSSSFSGHLGEDRVGRLEQEVLKIGGMQNGMQSTLEAILAQLSGRGGSSVQASDSHVSPASSSSQAMSHHSMSITPQQLSLPVTQQQQQQAQQGLLGGQTFAFPGGAYSSPSGNLNLGGGIPTSAYSPLNLASPSFGAHLFSNATQGYSPTPHAHPNPVGVGPGAQGNGGGGEPSSSSSTAPPMLDQSAFNRMQSDMRSDWLPNTSALAAATVHDPPRSTMMPPPPLPDFLRRAANREGGQQQDIQSGYRADTEDSYGIKRPRRDDDDDDDDESESGTRASKSGRSKKREKFPELPGFAPPETHRFAPYEIVPSTAVSSEDESEDTLPRATLSAPSLALEGLANAAAAAADGTLSPPRALRMRRRKRAPAPPIFFPDVTTKGLVSEDEARALYGIFFSGAQLFVPLFDSTYDTFDDLRVRTPFTLNGILAIAAKVRAGPNPTGEVFKVCLNEAQGIARSTLFGPIVQKEAVQAILLLATHSQNSYLPSGHALRAGLDFGLHRALEKLVQGHPGGRSDAEERDLVVSSRIWLTLFWFDRLNGLGNGRPILLREDDSVAHARFLLTHRMRSNTDVRLVAMLELVLLRTHAYDRVQELKGSASGETLQYIQDVDQHLTAWYTEWDEIHLNVYGADSLCRKMLLAELHYARLYVNCLALRGVSWERMPLEQRDLALKAKEAATQCLDVFLGQEYRVALRFAIHESLVMATFSACYLLKVAILFPDEIAPRGVLSQVQALADLLSEISAERYALTLRLMLSSFRRKFTITQPSTPRINPMLDGQTVSSSTLPHQLQPGSANAGGSSNFTWDEFPSFDWPDAPDFSPDIVPDWLRENSLTDLGLPAAGSDSIFIPFDLQHVVSDSPWGFSLDASQFGAAW